MKSVFEIRKVLQLLAAAAACVLVSCSHTVGYDLGAAEVYNGTPVAKSIHVKLFEDASPRDEKINIKIGTQSWRINAREGYNEEETLTQGVSRQIASHIEHSKTFNKVFYPNENPVYTDLVLTGTIYDYAAMGKVRKGAETGVIVASTLLSIPGALISSGITAPMKTTLKTSVELRDLKLVDPYTGRVVWSKDKITRQEDYTRHFMKADAAKLYKLADSELKLIVNEMITGIVNAPEIRTPRPVVRRKR